MKLKTELTKGDLKAILGELGTFLDSYDERCNRIGTKKYCAQARKTFHKIKKLADSIGGI